MGLPDRKRLFSAGHESGWNHCRGRGPVRLWPSRFREARALSPDRSGGRVPWARTGHEGEPPHWRDREAMLPASVQEIPVHKHTGMELFQPTMLLEDANSPQFVIESFKMRRICAVLCVSECGVWVSRWEEERME